MKQRMQFYTIDLIWRMPLLLFLLVVYLAGTIVGASAGILGSHSDALQPILSRLLDQSTTPSALPQLLGSAVGSTLLWFCLCILSGLFVPALLFCSLVIALRGFLLSFSVSALMLSLGLKGILLSLATFGLSAIFSVPCLLLTAAAVLDTAGSLPKGQRRRYFYDLGRYRSAILVCAVISILSTVLRAASQPFLMQWIVTL